MPLNPCRMTETHPNASWFTDRHGTVRWRFRRGSKTVSLPHAPGHPEFETAYLAAVEGRDRPKAKVVQHPSASLPKTMGAAWRRVLASPEWKSHDPATKAKNTRLAEEFLRSHVGGSDLLWQDAPLADLRRRHLKDILARHSDTPHKAKHLLVAIRKMIHAGLDEEWIETDPSYKLTFRPEYKGWKAWGENAREKFEARWPVGTTPRLVYAVALWLGNRRGDVAGLRWDHRETRRIMFEGEWRAIDGFSFFQRKGGGRRHVFIPINPMLAECLEAAPKAAETVLVTIYGEPFSEKSLTGRMADWTRAAGLAPGHTLHGLRKTLGSLSAEGDATTRQLMELLGHDDIEHAELYSRDAEKTRLATQAMDKVVRFVRRK